MMRNFLKISSFLLIFSFLAILANAQSIERNFAVSVNNKIDIKNPYGRVSIFVEEMEEYRAFLTIDNAQEAEVTSVFVKNRFEINVEPEDKKKRIDISLKIPPRMDIQIETLYGEVRIEGNIKSADVKTDTGTIAANVPLDDLKYDFVWRASRPRLLSDVQLEEIKEKAAGKFVVKGKYSKAKDGEDKYAEYVLEKPDESSTDTENNNGDNKKKQKDKQLEKTIELNLATDRGIILLNVNPGAVPSDLRERPLTKAAKAIVRSGDSLLVNAIRRASPKYFGEYTNSLPGYQKAPTLTENTEKPTSINAKVKKVLVKVTDFNNRSISDLQKEDFILTERGEEREVLSVEPTTAPFNLVLLLDVSGSIDNYVDFIRKAARSFVNTVNPNDKVAIILFNEDVEVLSNFTTDKSKLSTSLDTFDAGGGTAYYDALGYVLAETLRPLQGERTAIVVLSDGDDTRSFLPFEALLGTIQESGALIYPLYVPSELIAASSQTDSTKSVDPLRTRYIGLTSKAKIEGENLAKISGGIYYQIKQTSEIQEAYNDIVNQLRTAYSITFRSDLAEVREGIASPRLKVKVKRENAFVKLGSVVAVDRAETSEVKKKSKQLIRNISYVKPNLPAEFIQTPEITGEVDSIKYQQFVQDKLRTYNFEKFDINKVPGAFILKKADKTLAVSRWISPKRTRSYPYERVYDTLAYDGKKVAVIPVVKDEGLGGDRDFIQWDTISLLSLLDVHVVLAYYNDAIKNPRKDDKITKQKFDIEFVSAKLDEINNFKGTSRDWNEREAKNLQSTLEKAKLAYREISDKTKTYLHNEDKLDERIKYAETPQRFIGYSRRNAQNAQGREFQTIQPNEALSTLSKAKVTITNALFGKYYFTVDETLIEPKTISLIEAKHSSRSIFPSKNDIKDGLIKMMLYTNLQNVRFGENAVKYKVAIRLTSNKLVSSINSNSTLEEMKKFSSDNQLDQKQKDFLTKLFEEAKTNNFTIILEKGETAK